MRKRFIAAVMLCLGGLAQGQAAPQNQPPPAGARSAPKINSTDGGFQFSDTPAFSIAGVTDWTAVGGHGSDATLRTSEDLNRETLALAARKPTPDRALDAPGAETQLKSALAAAPGEYAANSALGIYYLHAGRFREAITPLKAALEASPASAEVAYSLAQAFLGMSDTVSAAQLIQDALKHSETADLHRLAGELDEALGKPLEAVREEERATRLDPSEENYFTWGSELLLHRAIWQAAQVFASGVKAHPASARLHTALGAALFSEAKYEEAAGRLCEAAALDPRDREPYVFLGKAAMASPVPLPCAQARLEQFARSRPDDAEANYYLAMTLLKQASPPEPERAVALLHRAVTLNPKYAEVYLQLGVLAFSRKSYPEAIEYLTKAVEADPQLGEAHYRLAVIYDRLGDATHAKREFHLHETADAANAVRIEQQRREVKQFLVTSAGQPADATAR